MNLERWDIVVSSFSPPSPNIQPIHPPCSELELALGQAGGHVLGDSRLLRGLDRKYRGVFLLAPDHGLGSSTGGCWDKEYGGFWEDINSEIRRSPGRRSTSTWVSLLSCAMLLKRTWAGGLILLLHRQKTRHSRGSYLFSKSGSWRNELRLGAQKAVVEERSL